MNLKKRKKGHPSYRILDDGSFKVYLRDGTSKVYSKFETEIIRREAESLFRIGRNVEGAKLLDDLLSGEIKVKGKKEAIYHFDKTAEGEIIPISPGTESVSIDYGSYKKVFYNINGSLTETVHSDESYNHNSVKLFEKQRAAIQSLRKLESLKDLMEDPKARRYAAVAGGTVGLMCLMSAAPAFASSMNGSSSADTNSYISPPLEQLVETQLPPPNMLPQDYSNKRLDLETGKWVDREGYDGKESASNEDNSKAEKGKKRFNPFSLGNLAWEVPVAILAGYGISKLIGTKPIQEEEKVQIRARIDSIVDSLTNENIPGARISYVYNGQTIPGTVGQYTNIAEIKKGTSITVEMIAEADNYVQRKILQAIMDGDENYTLNIAPRTKTIQIDGANYTFNYDTFVNEIVKNNIIAGLKPPANGVLNVHFTEDRDDSGERFRPEYINELKNVWNWVKDHYGGRITSINYVLNSDKTKTDIPGQGDIFISPSTKGHAASSSCWTNSDGSVYGARVYFNPNVLLSYNGLWTESFDSIFNREINLTKDAWKPLFIFAGERNPGSGNGTQFFLSNEQQNTPDSYSGSSAQTATAMLNAISRFDSAMQQANMPSVMRKKVRVGKRANLEAGLGPSGKVSIGGSYDIGDKNGTGNIMFMTDITGRNFVVGGDKRFGEQYIGLIYDDSSRQARFNGNFTLPLGIKLAGSIDNIIDPRIIPLGASYNRNGLGVSGAVDNLLNVNRAAGQLNVDAGNFDFAARHIYNRLGSDLTGLGITYDFGKFIVNVDASTYDKSHALNIGLLSKALRIAGAQGNFSITGGINSKGDKRIYISFAATGF